MHELTQQGIAALKAGDREGARRLLAEAVDQDENDATAWLWLAAALTHEADRVTCLRQVLKLDPQNQAAKRGLAMILNHPLNAAPEPATAQVPQEVAEVPQEVVRPIVAEAQQEVVAEAPQEVAQQEVVAEAPQEVAQQEVVAEVRQEVVRPIVAEAPQDVAEARPAVIDAATATVVAASESVAPADAAPAATAATANGAVIPPSVMEADYQRRKARREAEMASAQPAEVIFTARPSQVPALICFWLFLIGAGVVGALLGQVPGMGEPVPLVPGNAALSLTLNTIAGFVLALLLELVVLYVVIRNFVARYQLTDRQLIVRFRGRRARINLQDIFSAECHQNAFQKLTGTGDTEVEAVINGQLVLVRLRNIADCARHTAQIQALILN